MIKSSILFNDKTYPVEFFRDDTIEIVQQQISRSIDIHPDRLYILVGLKLSKNYYSRDPRNWEKLFERLSLDGKNILPETFKAYCEDLRIPNLEEEYQKYDREEWMQYKGPLRNLKSEFSEYRILGVESVKSYCLPNDFSSIAQRISPAQLPIPESQKLFLSFYGDLDILNFRVFEGNTESSYLPLLRSISPQRLTELQIKSLESNSQHLKDLLHLECPSPEKVIILKASWHIDLVDTNFGEAVRTRFEQIFYGLSMSPSIPVITLWTSANEVSRHKFFRNSGQQIPYLDVAMWKRWFTKTKPIRPRPTLVFYKGTSRENFDRIAISSIDVKFTSYRDHENQEDQKTLQTNLLKWFMTFDALIPFMQETDYALCRLELQEIKFEAFYSKTILKFDTSRMNCLTSIFEESTKNKSIFRFLRSDHLEDDLNPRDIKVMNLLRENFFVTPSEIEKELKISLYDASVILDNIKRKIEEEPELLESKEHHKFPKVEIREKSLVIAYVNEIDRYLTYSNILRYILSNPTSKELNKICPKKIESSDTTFSVSINEEIDDSDLFDFLEKEPPKKTETPKNIKTSSGYSYFYDRLKTKEIELASNYTKKCEKQHQPSVFTDEDLAELSGTPYDPQNYKDELKLEIDGGLTVCPEYWCMTDEIPLQKSQLEELNGELVCPICHGKIRAYNDKKSDIVDFSVIERKTGYIYPGYPKENIEKNIPCCYTTPYQKTLEKPSEDHGKYYIMNEEKSPSSLRLAYVNKQILKSLFINEKYELAKSSVNRIQAGMSGFFRVGMIRPSIELPTLLRLTKPVLSPRLFVQSILKCSFIPSWSKLSDIYVEDIEKELTMKPFSENLKARRKMAQIISSISEDFEAGTLNKNYELEYSAIILKTDLFKINILTNTFVCAFSSQLNRNEDRGIIILNSGENFDCLSYVQRIGKKLKFRSNIFEEPFTEKTFKELLVLQEQSCSLINIPSYSIIYTELKRRNIQDYSIILDSFSRAQAFYSPGKFILPFQSTSFSSLKRNTLSSYSDIDDLPSYEETLKILQEFKNYYIFSEDIHDSKGNVVEIITTSGLRIPVKPFKKEGENTEIYSTMKDIQETELTFGDPSIEDTETYKKISYKAEIHEFLIFQLSKDLEGYPELRHILLETPKSKKLEILLYNWFSETTKFMNVETPIEFLSKIRKPCGQLKENTCNSAHMCAWTSNKCKVQIRDEFSEDKVFKKLLNTLSENSKIRALVLDGRVTPFFSTILYLELPNEIMITDREIKQFTQGEP
jgi:hypothetical protein